jgi:hypothetical protein
LLLILLLACVACRGAAGEPIFESVGVRYGFSENRDARGLNQAEIFSTSNLPWHWVLPGSLTLQSRFELSLGWLGGRNDNSFLATAGPSLILGQGHLPVHLDFGVSPTVLSRHEWGAVNVGSLFQFTTHIGMDWDVTSRIRVGYRFSHMSDAGIAEPNPGLNMHVFGVSYLF